MAGSSSMQEQAQTYSSRRSQGDGKEADFQLFMALLDGDRFEGRFRDGVHTTDASDLMRRLVKEQLLTGQLPFTGTMLQVMFQHFSTPPTPPSHINPALPAEIDTVILHALAKEPNALCKFAHQYQM